MAAGPIRVLLVEDNSGDAFMVEKHLHRAARGDIVVERVDRLVPALEIAKSGRIDVVLLDLSLPDFQGIDTFIEARIQIPHVPIVVLTGFHDDVLAARAVQAGAQDYLVKGSVDGEGLVRAIRHAIERHRAETVREELLDDDRVEAVQHLATGVAQLVDAPVRDLIADMLAMGEAIVALRDAVPPTADDGDWNEQTVPSGQEQEDSTGLLGTLDSRRRHALDAAKRVQAITNDLQAFGGIELHEPRPVSLNALIREIAETVGREGDTEIQLELEALPDVHADRSAMARLIGNLLHYFTDGSDGNHPKLIRVSSRHIDPIVAVEVTDEGPALSDEDRAQIFEPFAAHRRSKRGSGLGLAVSAEIARAHGGLVSLTTTEDDRNRFQLELPVAARPAR